MKKIVLHMVLPVVLAGAAGACGGGGASDPVAESRGAATSTSTTTIIRVGSDGDVSPTLHGPVVHLGGGGPDVDAAMQKVIDDVRGCTHCSTKLDVVILRSTGTDAYNAPILAMNGVSSVTTVLLTNAAAGDDPKANRYVRDAEVVFFAGGDQCSYVGWVGTALQRSVQSVYDRGGSIGGTSAGDAIEGPYIYDACKARTDLVSSAALANPMDPTISFTYGMFHDRFLDNLEMEPHFNARDRMGRSMAFVARQVQEGRSKVAASVAVNEGTSVVVEPSGIGTVEGAGPAYVIAADHPCETCKVGSPLTFTSYKIWRLDAGETFDFNSRPSTGCYKRSVSGGHLSGDPYNGAAEEGCHLDWTNGTSAGDPGGSPPAGSSGLCTKDVCGSTHAAPGSSPSCFCDFACLDHGDCCANKIDLCGR